ncbi:MAG: tetratricopeptide repeat protein [Lachnospiraceae bacterium]
MRCYHCGARLNEHSFCTACKNDVSLYKQVIETANQKYNDGLDKANVKNLSGAKDDLREALSLYAAHTDARNLLGLILFETGEVFAALVEWIISKSFETERNVADDYIDKIQNDPNKLEEYARAVRKYNLALNYSRQDTLDLAIIQLKKVISIHKNYLEAKLLLALIYLEQKEWEKAYKLVAEVLKVDVGNVKARLYMQELKMKLRTRSVYPKDKPTSTRKEIENELIIQPIKAHEPSTAPSSRILVGFVIGALLGISAMVFLVFPGQILAVRTQSDEQIRVANESLDAQGVTIIDLEAQIGVLEEELSLYNDEYVTILGEDVDATLIQDLMIAVEQYLLHVDDVSLYSTYIDACIAGEAYYSSSPTYIKNMYQALIQATAPIIAENASTSGMSAYYANNYDEAITLLTQAVKYDATNVDDLYYLGNVYRDSGDQDNAIEVYNKVIELFPDTQKAHWAQSNINSY